MRAALIALTVLAAACSPPDAARQEADAITQDQPILTEGEERAHIAPRGEPAVMLRSGPQVPVKLPPGFTIFPGATVISNTVVERADGQRVLLVFETPEPVARVMLHYRTQAQAAGATLALDLGGKERASIGGRLAPDGKFAVSAQRAGAVTRVEFSSN